MSDISVERGTFTKQVDLSMGTAVNSAGSIDLGATDGNTVIILGTTNISDLGTAPQAGVRRTVIFADALTLIYGINLLCFGEANITTDTGDIAEFVAISTTQWKMLSYSKLNGYSNGLISSVGLATGSVTTAKLADAAVTNSKLKTKGVTALADTAVVLTAANIIDKGVFTAVPTANRIQTTDTATAIIAAIPGYQVGTSFEFTIVNTAAFNETLSAGTGVTIVGNAVVNNASATFIGVITAPTTLTIYRK